MRAFAQLVLRHDVVQHARERQFLPQLARALVPLQIQQGFAGVNGLFAVHQVEPVDVDKEQFDRTAFVTIAAHNAPQHSACESRV